MASWFNSTSDVRRLGGTAGGSDFQRLIGQRPGQSDLQRLLNKKPPSDFERLLQQKRVNRPSPFPYTDRAAKRAALRRLGKGALRNAARQGWRSSPYGRTLDILEMLINGTGLTKAGGMRRGGDVPAGWVAINGRMWSYTGLGYPAWIEGFSYSFYSILDPAIFGWPHAMHYWDNIPHPPAADWVDWLQTLETLGTEPNDFVPVQLQPKVVGGMGTAFWEHTVKGSSAYRWIHEPPPPPPWLETGYNGSVGIVVSPRTKAARWEDGKGKPTRLGMREKKPDNRTRAAGVMWMIASLMGGLQEGIDMLAEASGWRYDWNIGGTHAYNKVMWLFAMGNVSDLDWQEYWNLLIDNALEDAFYGVLGRMGALGYRNMGVTVGVQPRLAWK